MERESDQQIGATSAEMQTLYRIVVVRRKMILKVKLLVYKLICSKHHVWPWALGNNWKSADTSDQTESPSQVGWAHRVRRLDTWRELEVESLLFCVWRSQLRWFGLLIRMPPGRLPVEVFQASPTGKRLCGRPCWKYYISHLAWERLRRNWRTWLGRRR